MPWCSGCDRFLSPSTVLADGACPRCGARVDPGQAHAPEPEAEVGSDADPEAAGDDDTMALPWHFKALVAAVVLYLGWRAVQGIEWVARQF